MIEKDQLVAAARDVAARLGRRSIGLHEFTHDSGIGTAAVYRHFDTWSALCVRAGLAPPRIRHEIRDDEIFEGLRRAFVAYGGVCARLKIAPHLEFPIGIVIRRFPTWRDALEAFRRWLVAGGVDFPHMGELGRRIAHAGGPLPRLRPPPTAPSIAPPDAPPSGSPDGLPSATPSAPSIGASSAPPKLRTWRPLDGRSVGELLDFRGIVRAPVNEMGVLALFAICARDLGFEIESFSPVFPDCRAYRRIGPGRWQEVRVELELQSRNFVLHGHDPKGCEIVVCWEHNWPDCPLEVIVLKDEVRKLMEREGR